MIQKYKQRLWVALGCLFLATLSSSALANQLRDELLKAADIKSSGDYVRTRFLKAIKNPVNPKASKKALIIGDSHAQDFFNSVVENNFLQDYQISTRSIPTRCQVYLGDNHSKFIASKDEVFCEKSDNLEKAKHKIAEVDLVILVANWTKWSATELPKTIENMQLTDKQKLLVIGRKSFGKVAVRKYLRLPEEKLQTLRNKPDVKQNKINSIMRNTLSKDVLIDLQQLACGATATCPVFTKDLKLISFDGGHLTKNGAQYIGELLFENSQLGSL
ncbi:MAG: SGNH hydrolase domain-containing protein [Thiotrichaceae bacterium]